MRYRWPTGPSLEGAACTVGFGLARDRCQRSRIAARVSAETPAPHISIGRGEGRAPGRRSRDIGEGIIMGFHGDHGRSIAGNPRSCDYSASVAANLAAIFWYRETNLTCRVGDPTAVVWASRWNCCRFTGPNSEWRTCGKLMAWKISGTIFGALARSGPWPKERAAPKARTRIGAWPATMRDWSPYPPEWEPPEVFLRP